MEEVIYSYQKDKSKFAVYPNIYNNNWLYCKMSIEEHYGDATYSFSVQLDNFIFPPYHEFSVYCDEEFWEKVKSDIQKIIELKVFI